MKEFFEAFWEGFWEGIGFMAGVCILVAAFVLLW